MHIRGKYTDNISLCVSLSQYVLTMDSFQLGYNQEGHCKGDGNPSLPHPLRFSWDIPSQVHMHSYQQITFRYLMFPSLIFSFSFPFYSSLVSGAYRPVSLGSAGAGQGC